MKISFLERNIYLFQILRTHYIIAWFSTEFRKRRMPILMYYYHYTNTHFDAYIQRILAACADDCISVPKRTANCGKYARISIAFTRGPAKQWHCVSLSLMHNEHSVCCSPDHQLAICVLCIAQQHPMFCLLINRHLTAYISVKNEGYTWMPTF